MNKDVIKTIKDKRYIGDLSKKEIVELFKSLKFVNKKVTLDIGYTDKLWWYVLSLNQPMLFPNSVTIISKYNGIAISSHKDNIVLYP